MKTISIIIVLLSVSVLAQTIEESAIQKLVFESKYSQVVSILTVKTANLEELTYTEKFYLAISYQRLFNHNKAIQILISMNEENFDNTTILFAMGESYRALGNTRAAIGVYKNAAKKDTSNIIVKIELAKLYLELKNYELAKNIFETLVEQDSSNAYYLREYGYLLHKLGVNEEAQKYLGKALEINKYDSKTALWLAKIFYDFENYDNSLKVTEESLSSNSSYLPLHMLKAEILYKMERYSEAANQYKNIIVLSDSSNSTMFQKLGLSLYSFVANSDALLDSEKEENIREAIEAFEQSNALDNFSNPLTLTYLGFCFKTLENYQTAIVYLEKALDAMTPNYIDRVYYNLGASYELMVNYPEAIKAFTKSLKYSNQNPSTIFRLAAVYDRYYYDKSVALAHYKKYLNKVDYLDDETTQYSENRIERLEENLHFRRKNYSD